jgi:radical SAM superfamily enzyme YgiQ (UPF0313 family)
MSVVDIALVHIPRYVHASDPPISISVLAAYLRYVGLEVATLDFNLDWYRTIRDNRGYYEELDEWLMLKNTASELSETASRIFGNVVGQPFSEGSTASTNHDPIPVDISMLSPGAQRLLSRIITNKALTLIDMNPLAVGISLFTYNSLKYFQLLRTALHDLGYPGKIIVGGPGTLPVRTAVQENVDLYVTVGGEAILTEYMLKLKGLSAPEFEGTLYPDYSTYEWGAYLSANKSLRITGSHGCIRRCNFCDIYKQWPEFITRDGRDVANEMIHQNETLNVHPTKFYFTDSLINGNPKNLRLMCSHLERHRATTGVTFQWEGQFIAMSPKFWGVDDYRMMKSAGCNRVSFGIESGSSKVRNDMRKKMRDDDLDFCITQLAENQIEQVWLIIVGFPTETREDFMQTLRLFYKHRDKTAVKPIQVGLAEFRPDQGTDWHIQEATSLTWDENSWVWDGNAENTATERRLRLLLLERLISQWGFIHRAQNSPFTGESSNVVTLNSLYYADRPDDDLSAFRDELLMEFGDELLQIDL